MTVQELQEEINKADKVFAERRAEIDAEIAKLQKELNNCYASVANVIVANKAGTRYRLQFSRPCPNIKSTYPIFPYHYATHLTRRQNTEVKPEFEVVSYEKNYTPKP